MKLKFLLPYLKGLNNTVYEFFDRDKHYVVSIDDDIKKYSKYYVLEIFKKAESPNSVWISISKNKVR